jgi:hypothetical protein
MQFYIDISILQKLRLGVWVLCSHGDSVKEKVNKTEGT